MSPRSSEPLRSSAAHRAALLILALAPATGLATSCAASRSAQAPSPLASEPPGPGAHPRRFTGAVTALADKLEASYVIRDVGARYAARLRANLAQGAYDAFSDAGAIADQLSDDLQAVAPDGHLQVMEESNLTPDGHMRRPPRRNPLTRVTRAADPGNPPRDSRGPRVIHGPEGPGGLGGASGPGGPDGRRRMSPIGDIRWVADGVAYIQLYESPGTPENVAAVDRFMAEHASAKAIIIDARGHHGGTSAEMDVMLPYLYATETPLVDMEVTEEVEHGQRGTPPPDFPPQMRKVPAPPGMVRREQVVTPHATEHRLFTAKVFYLTSAQTASAGEHLAFALKRTGRAVLIGERTAGANHFGNWEPIGDGIAAFIPLGRTFDPVTGADWEGVGVDPDVAVPADGALDEAVRRATH